MTPEKKTEMTTNTKRRRLYYLPALLVIGVAVVGLLSPGATTHTASASTSTGAINALQPPNPIKYQKLPKSYIVPGEQLFQANCASCHGVDGTGGAVGVPDSDDHVG